MQWFLFYINYTHIDSIFCSMRSRGEQKNQENQENQKKNRKNRTVKKNQLNRIQFWKNQPVRLGFDFISLKLKKPNPNRKKQKKNRGKPKNQAKPEKTEPNRFDPVFILKNRTERKPVGLNRFRFGFGFLFKFRYYN
jgi:hypothetical protein